MENGKTWLLVADASKARIYSMYKARVFREPTNLQNLELINQFSHPASRKKNIELATDAVGDFGVGAFVEATSPKAHEAEVFAIQLVDHLESARKENGFHDLILVAPPTFMGLLNKHMSQQINKIINKSIEKDFTSHNERELLASLINYL